jgi:hypothetical protein
VASDEWGLTIPLDPKYREPVQAAAAQDLEKMAGYSRKLILKDLQSRGLLDANWEPIKTTETADK